MATSWKSWQTIEEILDEINALFDFVCMSGRGISECSRTPP